MGTSRSATFLAIATQSGIGHTYPRIAAEPSFVCSVLGLFLTLLLFGSASLTAQNPSQDMFKTLSPHDPPETAQTSEAEAFKKASIFSAQNNYTDALFWYERALVKGNSDAAAEIGMFYSHGLGVKEDHSMALRWYQWAADHKNALATLRMAGFYQHGLGGAPKDPKHAVELLNQAYALGSSEAAFDLAIAYKYGVEGVLTPQPAVSQAWKVKAMAELEKAESLCQNGVVKSAMQQSMVELVRGAYTSAMGMTALAVMAGTNMPIAPPPPTRAAHALTGVNATSRLSEHSADCDATFANDPTNWAYQVYRLPDNGGDKYFVLTATGAQWVAIQGYRVTMMMSGEMNPQGLHNMHDYDPIQ